MQIFDEEVSFEEVKDSFGPLDLWILSKLNNLNVNVDKAFAEQYHQLKGLSGMISVMSILKL